MDTRKIFKKLAFKLLFPKTGWGGGGGGVSAE